LLADSTWKTAICNSIYFKRILNLQVPVMTSINTPSGSVHYSSVYESYYGWKAFQGDVPSQMDYSHWLPAGSSFYNYYTFEKPAKMYMGVISGIGAGTPNTMTCKLKAYNESSEKVDLTDSFTLVNAYAIKKFIFNNPHTYATYGVEGTQTSSASGMGVAMNFYGRVDV